MVWDIATDDFRGACGRGANPLLSVIAKVLTGSSPGSSARPPTARSVAVDAQSFGGGYGRLE